MGSVLSFILGVVIGVVGAWWFFERRDAKSRQEMEAFWKKKLEHVEAEVQRADMAHNETKEKLRLLQHEQITPPPGGVPSTTTPPASVTKQPAAPAAEQPQGEAERLAQQRRRIDAKLAQLPAGSSARRRLLAERAALVGQKADTAKPQPLFTPPSEPPDDLERIRGIGAVLRQRLNNLGITTFAQIAAFSEADLARVDEVLNFKGRIAREGWVEQAKALRDGG